MAFLSEDDDIAVLRAVDKLDDRALHDMGAYPQIGREPLRLGSTVGFMSRLSLNRGSQKPSIRTHLAVGTVSMFVPREQGDGVNFAVSSTVMQKGFSGSAVFRPSGDIVAVLVQSLRFRADADDPRAPLYVLPVVVPITSLKGEIDAAMGKNEEARFGKNSA